MSRRIANIHRNITVTPFLNKLYSMVDDESSDDLIRWSDDGNSFLVLRHEDFAKEVLPKFFKHSNFSSFVRQLNMYGFHKVPHLQQGGLINDSPDAESWEFSNENFQRGQPDLLHYIRRKKGNRDSTPVDQDADLALMLESTDGASVQGDEAAIASTAATAAATTASTATTAAADEQNYNTAAAAAAPKTAGARNANPTSPAAKPRASRVPPVNLAKILKEIQVIRDHQYTISADIKHLQEDNQSLWLEASATQERYKRHQETIDKILRFLASVFSSDARNVEVQPQTRRLLSHSIGADGDQAGDGNDISSLRAGQSQSRSRPSKSPNRRLEGISGGNTAAETAPHPQDIFDGVDFDDILSSEQPPDKKLRTSNSQSSRILELPSMPSSPADSIGRRTPRGTSSAATGSGIRRHSVSSRTSQAAAPRQLQKTRPSAASPALPLVSEAVSSNALVSLADNAMNRLSSHTKSIDQLQKEVEHMGLSLDSITQQLLPAANWQASSLALSPHQPSLNVQPPGLGATNGTLPHTTVSSGAAASASGQIPALDDIASSLFTPEALNSLALSLSQPSLTSSVPATATTGNAVAQAADSQQISAQDDLASSLLSPDAMNNLALTLSQANGAGAASNAANGSSTMLNGPNAQAASAGTGTGTTNPDGTVDSMDPALLSSILESYTPEQLDSMQRLFSIISGSKGTVPLLTAGSEHASSAQSPEDTNDQTPFLDFVDPNADPEFNSGT